MPRSRLLAVLSSDPDGPVVRHRWAAFAPALLERGIVLEVVDWPKDAAARRHALHRAETADGVVVSSRLLRRSDTRSLRRRAARLAFDFDDALPYRDSSRGAGRSWTRRRRFSALVGAADLVIAGNAYLAQLAARYDVRASIVPTVVDVADADLEDEPAMPPPVLGWIGARATIPYLEARYVILSAVVATGRPFRLRVIADATPAMPPGIAVEAIPWTLEGWRHDLAGMHVGLAPLPDDPWARGKCGLKVLQMMSVGRPVVASAVGVQVDQVEDGVTGFVAGTRETFFEALLTLLDDADLRARMGRAGWERVRAHWSVAAWSGRFADLVDEWLG